MRQQTNLDCNFPLSTGFANFSNSTTSLSTANIIMLVVQDRHGIGKYSVYEIANWFLSKEPLAHKKLQKLCYYAQAWFIALRDIRLTDAVFEAWVHGPVSPVLYECFKEYGYSTIRIAGCYTPTIEEGDIELLESVWQTYGYHTGNALEALSHKEPPWIAARRGYAPDERCNVPILLDSMKAYYETIYTGGEV
ncbi:MAG: DUF4065 domain-containing protein [Clostridiales bacterium]|nr:DUF4065 domain-containing protein [Clostridiales bacterium]